MKTREKLEARSFEKRSKTFWRMKKKTEDEDMFGEELPSRLAELKRQRLNVQARIDKVMETLSELNAAMKSITNEIDLLERQINLF